eukprot:TRINITY_DN20483_c0_g1_i1.p1 TRINITY_DN20483_c0_g1~~TRINITY_DN20483_c0_g1_i1.p1  ORF type:complete len:365 (-),score=114.98 TRINITY_DN20483_c0_g1_i1:52-1146(-)
MVQLQPKALVVVGLVALFCEDFALWCQGVRIVGEDEGMNATLVEKAAELSAAKSPLEVSEDQLTAARKRLEQAQERLSNLKADDYLSAIPTAFPWPGNPPLQAEKSAAESDEQAPQPTNAPLEGNAVIENHDAAPAQPTASPAQPTERNAVTGTAEPASSQITAQPLQRNAVLETRREMMPPQANAMQLQKSDTAGTHAPVGPQPTPQPLEKNAILETAMKQTVGHGQSEQGATTVQQQIESREQSLASSTVVKARKTDMQLRQKAALIRELQRRLQAKERERETKLKERQQRKAAASAEALLKDASLMQHEAGSSEADASFLDMERARQEMQQAVAAAHHAETIAAAAALSAKPLGTALGDVF